MKQQRESRAPFFATYGSRNKKKGPGSSGLLPGLVSGGWLGLPLGGTGAPGGGPSGEDERRVQTVQAPCPLAACPSRSCPCRLSGSQDGVCPGPRLEPPLQPRRGGISGREGTPWAPRLLSWSGTSADGAARGRSAASWEAWSLLASWEVTRGGIVLCRGKAGAPAEPALATQGSGHFTLRPIANA